MVNVAAVIAPCGLAHAPARGRRHAVQWGHGQVGRNRRDIGEACFVPFVGGAYSFGQRVASWYDVASSIQLTRLEFN